MQEKQRWPLKSLTATNHLCRVFNAVLFTLRTTHDAHTLVSSKYQRLHVGLVQTFKQQLCLRSSQCDFIMDPPYRALGSRAWSCVTTLTHSEPRLYKRRPQEAAPEAGADIPHLNLLHQPKPLERGATHTPGQTSPDTHKTNKQKGGRT